MSGKGGNMDHHGRQDRLLKEHVHDPYMASGKLSEPTVCPQCNAVFAQGRWQWKPVSPKEATEQTCPACRRMNDKVPAGFLTLRGEFFASNRDEIMRLVDHKIEEQKTQHPMKRLMNVEKQDDGSTLLTFTDMHLPRGVGEAIESAYSGELEIQYTKDAGIVRVYWQR
jgi:NMD protein affecting ribosome stability and mRNA decay